jgi:hypothetical protein
MRLASSGPFSSPHIVVVGSSIAVVVGTRRRLVVAAFRCLVVVAIRREHAPHRRFDDVIHPTAPSRCCHCQFKLPLRT